MTSSVPPGLSRQKQPHPVFHWFPAASQSALRTAAAAKAGSRFAVATLSDLQTAVVLADSRTAVASSGSQTVAVALAGQRSPVVMVASAEKATSD